MASYALSELDEFPSALCRVPHRNSQTRPEHTGDNDDADSAPGHADEQAIDLPPIRKRTHVH
ncbi:hypothetical protein GCM10010256_65350 [Streptomyces coeruleorubidus]|nr:hypothetical protein GCM10010256_65350 [Streptomyces coeruleorubidus]